MAYSCTINGEDRSDNIDPRTIFIHDILNSEINEATFTMECPLEDKPIDGHKVILLDGANKEFAGTVVSAKEKEVEGSDNLIYEVTCHDGQLEFDKRLVYERYEDMTAGAGIRDFISNYCPGFTTNNVKDGPNVAGISLNGLRPSECMDKYKRITGYNWYIDEDYGVHFFEKEANAAPFKIDDDGDNHKGLQITPDRSQLCTRVTVYGGMARSQSPWGQDFKGDGVTRVWLLAYKPHSITIDVNGTPKTVGIDQINETGFDFYLNYQEKILKQDVSAPVLQGASGEVPADVLNVSYYYDTPVQVVVTDPEAIERVKALEGGEGVYEDTLEDSSVTDKLTARQLGRAYLAERSNTLLYGAYRTSTKGLRSGQIQRVTRTKRGIDNYFLITSVRKWLEGGEWKYEVEMSSTLKPVTFQSLLIKLLGGESIQENDSEIVDNIQIFKSKFGLRVTFKAYLHEFNKCSEYTKCSQELKI